MPEVPAAHGLPFSITDNGRTIRLARTLANGREPYLILTPRDAVAVADALIDAVEGLRG